MMFMIINGICYIGASGFQILIWAMVNDSIDYQELQTGTRNESMVYSTYSFLKSGLTIEKIVSSVIKNDYFGVGISDISVMYAIPKFALECEKIHKPFIVGMEIEFNQRILGTVEGQQFSLTQQLGGIPGA